MEEGKPSAAFLPVDHDLRQLIVLLEDLRQVFLTDRVRVRILADHRLNGDPLKAKLCKMQENKKKIQVIPCKSASYVILLLVPALCQLLELRHDQVIASLPVAERAHPVIDFFSSVQAQDHIVHLFVDELLDLIV